MNTSLESIIDVHLIGGIPISVALVGFAKDHVRSLMRLVLLVLGVGSFMPVPTTSIVAMVVIGAVAAVMAMRTSRVETA